MRIHNPDLGNGHPVRIQKDEGRTLERVLSHTDVPDAGGLVRPAPVLPVHIVVLVLEILSAFLVGNEGGGARFMLHVCRKMVSCRCKKYSTVPVYISGVDLNPDRVGSASLIILWVSHPNRSAVIKNTL